MDQNADTIAGDTSNNRDLCIETYALLDGGSDNTQITEKVADALQVQQPKDITLPLASLHGEHSVKTADVTIGIAALCSSCPVIRIPVYATAMEEFRMPRVQIEMLNEHTHTQKQKLNIRKKTFCALFYCLHFQSKCCLFLPGV